MSTRGNIAIHLKPEDLNKTLTCKFGSIKTSIDKPVLQIYNHHDSYIEGVGANLIKSYNSYDKALKLVLEGDSTAVGKPYADWPDESYEDTQPCQMEAPVCDEEFLYVFDNDCWWVVDYPEEGYKMLSTYFE